MAESFFASLECELIDRSRWRTHSEARMAVFDYIECFYNPRRRHSALSYLSPAQFEREPPARPPRPNRHQSTKTGELHLRLALEARSRWLAPSLALGIILGTPQALESFWTGEADLALTIYLSLTVLALLRWCDSHERSWVSQAMLFGAAAALTTYEGIFRVGVVLVAFGVEVALRRRPAQLMGAVAVAVASLAAYVSWAVFRSVHGIEVTAEHLGHLQPEAIGSVLVALVGALGGLRTGGGLVVAALGWLVAGKRIMSPRLRFLTFVVVGQLTTTLLAFLVTGDSPPLEVQRAATRLFEQFTPIALFATAVWLIESAQPLLDRRSDRADLYLRQDTHFTALGHQVTAQQLAEFLERGGWLH